MVSEDQEDHQQVNKSAGNHCVHGKVVAEVPRDGLEQDDEHVVDRSQCRNNSGFAAQVGVPPECVHQEVNKKLRPKHHVEPCSSLLLVLLRNFLVADA